MTSGGRERYVVMWWGGRDWAAYRADPRRGFRLVARRRTLAGIREAIDRDAGRRPRKVEMATGGGAVL